MQHARLFWLFGAAFCALSLAAACSSSSSSGTSNGTDASTGNDSAVGTETGGGNENCVAPGTPNNEEGVGAYCDKAADCTTAGTLCTALFDAPPNAHFCSKFCSHGEACGTGEVCAVSSQGIACVPLVCFGDGGVIFDAGAD